MVMVVVVMTMINYYDDDGNYGAVPPYFIIKKSFTPIKVIFTIRLITYFTRVVNLMRAIRLIRVKSSLIIEQCLNVS